MIAACSRVNDEVNVKLTFKKLLTFILIQGRERNDSLEQAKDVFVTKYIFKWEIMARQLQCRLLVLKASFFCSQYYR